MIQDLKDIKTLGPPDSEFLAYWIGIDPLTGVIQRGLILEASKPYLSVKQVCDFVEKEHYLQPLLVLLGSGPSQVHKVVSSPRFPSQEEEAVQQVFVGFLMGTLAR